MKRIPYVILALFFAGVIVLIGVFANKERDSSEPWLRFQDERLVVVEARIIRQVRQGSDNRWGELTREEEPILLRFLARNGAPLSLHLPSPAGVEFSAVFVPWLREDQMFELTELWLETRRPGGPWCDCIGGGGTAEPIPTGEWALTYGTAHGESRPVARYISEEIQATILPADGPTTQGVGTVAALGTEQLHITQIAAPDRMTMGVFRYGKSVKENAKDPDIERWPQEHLFQGE